MVAQIDIKASPICYKRIRIINMINVQVSIVIHRPLGEVFAFLSNLENNLNWRTGMIEARKISEGPIGVGTTYRLINNFFGRRVEGDTEYELNRSYATVNKSGLPIETNRTFEPVERCTEVTFSVKAKIGGFVKLVEPLLARIGKRRLTADAIKVKKIIEANTL